MGDISAEPSMEEILSSIKRIIAEEGEGTPARRRPPRIAPVVPPSQLPSVQDAGEDLGEDDDEVLELSEPLADITPVADPELDTPVKMTRSQPQPHSSPPSQAQPQSHRTAPAPEPILSQETAAASRGSLETLSKLLTKPEPGSDGTLEGLVRDMLRPMLREWLDANLPDLVETLVAREIEKITGQPR